MTTVKPGDRLALWASEYKPGQPIEVLAVEPGPLDTARIVYRRVEDGGRGTAVVGTMPSEVGRFN